MYYVLYRFTICACTITLIIYLMPFWSVRRWGSCRQVTYGGTVFNTWAGKCGTRSCQLVACNMRGGTCNLPLHWLTSSMAFEAHSKLTMNTRTSALSEYWWCPLQTGLGSARHGTATCWKTFTANYLQQFFTVVCHNFSHTAATTTTQQQQQQGQQQMQLHRISFSIFFQFFSAFIFTL